MPLDVLLARRIEQERFLKEMVPNILPLFARSMMRGSTSGQIRMLNEYILMKARKDPLPPINELRHNPDLLLQILG